MDNTNWNTKYFSRGNRVIPVKIFSMFNFPVNHRHIRPHKWNAKHPKGWGGFSIDDHAVNDVNRAAQKRTKTIIYKDTPCDDNVTHTNTLACLQFLLTCTRPEFLFLLSTHEHISCEKARMNRFLFRYLLIFTIFGITMFDWKRLLQGNSLANSLKGWGQVSLNQSNTYEDKGSNENLGAQCLLWLTLE